eukprot:774024-Pyramimonas_sp.AAC.1
MYKGGGDGTSWADGFNSKTKAALLKHADATLMEFNGDELKTRNDALESHFEHYGTILNTFKTPMPADDAKVVADPITIAERTMQEAICIHALKDETGSEVGRRRKMKPLFQKLETFEGANEVLLSVMSAALGAQPKAKA